MLYVSAPNKVEYVEMNSFKLTPAAAHLSNKRREKVLRIARALTEFDTFTLKDIDKLGMRSTDFRLYVKLTRVSIGVYKLK